MGILKGREQLIPVTCAVLKHSDREAFFAQIQKNRAGNPEELAKWLGVPVSLINNWISGQLHIPYHTLQNIAYQFSLEMPPVGELRRESLPAEQLPSAQPGPAPAPPSGRAREPRTRERKRRPPKGERLKQGAPREQKIVESAAPAQEQPKPSWPKPSEALAYWAGILYAAARLEDDALSFAANRKIGQNFAGVWARKTKQLFGVACHLSMEEGGKVQHAKCEIPGINKYLARLCPGGGVGGETAALPRWIWSNPGWKSAYFKGLADVSAGFQRQPAVVLEVPTNMRLAVQKLLASLGFKSHENAAGFILSGLEEVKRYFDSIGTENMKLRDQWNNFCRGKSEEPGAETSEPETASPSSEAAPSTTKPEDAPTHRKRPSRPRRMVFRGRPGR